MTNTIGKNIKQLRTEKGMTQKDFARDMEISNSALSQYESGHRTISLALLNKFADFFNVTIDYLYGRKISPNMPHIHMTNPTAYTIPVVGTIRAGDPITAFEEMSDIDTLETVEIPENMAHDGSQYFGLKVIGDSMNLLGIVEGQTVIVRRQAMVQNGDIAVVLIDNEEATIKLFYYKDGVTTLVPRSTNMYHTPRTLDMDKVNVMVLGKVVRAINTFC